MGRFHGVFLVLFSALLLAAPAAAQQPGATIEGQEERESGFHLGRNYPNPFNPDTTIPFELFDDLFVDGRGVNVTIRIYNILRQYVSSPTASGHPTGDGTPVIDLEYGTPGRYEAHWDGRDTSGAFVASGVYILELTVNGRSQVRRMFVSG